MGILDLPGLTQASLGQVDGWRINPSQLGTTDDALVIEAAIASAVVAGYKKVILPPKQINIRSDIDITSIGGTGFEICGSGEGTVLSHVGGTLAKAMIYARGTDGTKVALTADLIAGTQVATIPTAVASTLAVGDVVGFESLAIAFSQDTSGSGTVNAGASEIRKIIAISSNQITLDGPLIWSYLVSDTAVCWRMNPMINIKFKNFMITSSDPLVNRLRGIYIDKATSVEIENITLRDAGGGVFLNDCLDAHVMNLKVDRLPNYGDFRGYGLAVTGRSAHVLATNLRGRGCRHVFTTLPDQRSDGSSWGGPRHIKVVGGVGEANNNYAVWDTHPHGYDITFNSCTATGGNGSGADGFQVRAKRVSIINPVAYRMGGSGIQFDATADYTRVVGGEIAYCTGGGTSIIGPNSDINGTYFHDNPGPGVIIGSSSSNSRITGCRFENNTYGVHDQSAGEHTKVVVGSGNAFPKSTTQTTAILSPKSDMVIMGNYMPGFGANADGVGGTIGGSVQRIANVIDGA